MGVLTSFIMSQVYMWSPWFGYEACKTTRMIKGEPNMIDNLPPDHTYRKAVCVLFTRNQDMCGLIMFNQLSREKTFIVIAEFSGLEPN